MIGIIVCPNEHPERGQTCLFSPRSSDGKAADTYLLQDKSPIATRFWYVSDDEDAGYDYFLQVGPVTLPISKAAHSDLEDYKRGGDCSMIDLLIQVG